MEVPLDKAFRSHHTNTAIMVLPGKQPGLLVAVIVPALLSTLVVIVRSTRKVKRRPSYISRPAALTAEILLIASVVGISLVLHLIQKQTELDSRSRDGSQEPSLYRLCTMDSAHTKMKFFRSQMECRT